MLLHDMLLADHIYAGTPLEFIPEWVAIAWRVLIFIVATFTVGVLSTINLKRYGRVTWRSKSFMWFHLALIATMILIVVWQIERFEDMVVLEGLPFMSLITALVILGIWNYKHEKER